MEINSSHPLVKMWFLFKFHDFFAKIQHVSWLCTIFSPIKQLKIHRNIRNKHCSLSSCQVLSMALSPFTSNLNKNSKHLFLETFLTVVEKSNLDHTTLTAFPSFQFLASAPSLSFNGAAQFFASALKQIGNMCFFGLITRVTCRLSYSIHALCSLFWTKKSAFFRKPSCQHYLFIFVNV